MCERLGHDIEKGVVGREAHKDGNFHLHAYIKFANALDVKNCKYFDFVHEGVTHHGNYQAAKKAEDVIRYCTKEDPTPLELGTMDFKQELIAKKNKHKILGKRLAEGDTVDQLIEDGETHLLFNYKSLVANV